MPTPNGTIPAPVAEAFQAGLFSLPEHALPTRTSVAQNQWRIPILMVGFSDAPLTISAAEFEIGLFDTTGATPNGSVFDYYQWVSGGRMRVTGRVVAIVNLPTPRDYYAYNFWGLAREATPQNISGMLRDALTICAGNVDWSEFDQNRDGYIDMLWVIHQGIGGETSPDRSHLWSITSRMSAGWNFAATFVTPQRIPGTSNSYYQIDRFSSLPELSTIIPGRRAEIGTFAHELGHALGLPDLYDTSGVPVGVVNVGPGNWSLMSTGAYGGTGLTPEQPSHLGAWCQRFLGWTQPIRPSEDTTITLRPIGRGDPPLEVWFQGESSAEYFLIENRFRESFDRRLYNDGLIITHVDDALIAARLPGNHVNAGPVPAYVMVEGDGDGDLLAGRNRGDPSDPLPGALNLPGVNDETLPNLRTFTGATTNLAIGELQQIGSDVRFRLQVRAPGWAPSQLLPSAFSSALDTGRPARWACGDSLERVFAVLSQVVGGIPQIVLHTRSGGVWQPTETVSLSTVAAFDPAIALLPGGDLSVAWTDARGGGSNIYLRQRVRGVWQPEVRLSETPGSSHNASIGSDRNGAVHVAWLNDNAGQRRIYFRRFAYISPFGMTSPVTFGNERPDPPALEVRPNGASYLVWADRNEQPARLYFARFHPDSGVSVRQPLTYTPASPQLSPSFAVDAAGTLHIAWRATDSGQNEVHYQRRFGPSTPAPRDTVIAKGANLLQNPTIAADDSGGVHLAFEDWSGSYAVCKYELFRPSRGWDLGSTPLADREALTIFPAVIPHGTLRVTTLYLEDNGSELQLVERRRNPGGSITLAIPARVPPAGGWSVHPNPLRAGRTLELALPGDGPDVPVEVFDLAGRRIAELESRREGGWRRATASPTVTRSWPAGIYFARPRGGLQASRFVVLD